MLTEYTVPFNLTFSDFCVNASFGFKKPTIPLPPGRKPYPSSEPYTADLRMTFISPKKQPKCPTQTQTHACKHTPAIPESLFSNRLWKWKIWKRPCHRDSESRLKTESAFYRCPITCFASLPGGLDFIHLQHSTYWWTNSHQTPTHITCLQPYYMHLPINSHTCRTIKPWRHITTYRETVW